MVEQCTDFLRVKDTGRIKSLYLRVLNSLPIMKILFLTKFLVILALSSALSQAQPLNKEVVFAEIARHINRSQPRAIVSDYFKIADVSMLIKTTQDHCAGVVIDREYLASSSFMEWITSNFGRAYILATEFRFEAPKPSILGLYQPRGWTGIAQSIGSVYELKYAGYIILADEVNSQNISTIFHESLHCFAAAIGRTDLDNDEYDGPGFYSDTFLKILKKLATNEKKLDEIVSKLSKGEVQTSELDYFWKVHSKVRNDFFTRIDVTTFGIPLEKAMQVSGDLHKEMGGKSDWEGYEKHVKRLIKEAEERGKLIANSGPSIKNGEPLKISYLQCPEFSNNYELRQSSSLGGPALIPGEVEVGGTLNKVHTARCSYAIRGREYLSFSYTIEWMESSDGLHHWCDREVGYSQMYTETKGNWRGPYWAHFSFGDVRDQVFAHNKIVATITVKQYEKRFISRYFSWSEFEKTFDGIFSQLEQHALPCEKK